MWDYHHVCIHMSFSCVVEIADFKYFWDRAIRVFLTHLVFKVFWFQMFKMFQVEIFNYTVLHNIILRSLTTFILFRKTILCQKLDHNPNSGNIKPEYFVKNYINYSGFGLCGQSGCAQQSILLNLAYFCFIWR